MSIRSALSRNAPTEIGVGAIFFVTAILAILVTREAGGVALIWPANAIAAALLIRATRVRWVLAGPVLFLAGMTANMLGARDSARFAAALTSVNLIEIVAMVCTYRLLFRFPYPRLTVNHAAHMTVVMGLGIPGCVALIGGLAVQNELGVPLTGAISQWWASDAVGACLCAPPIVLYSSESLRRLLQPRFLVPNVALWVVCVVACYVAIRYVKFPFVVFGLPLMVTAFRVGGFGASIFSFSSGLTVIAMWICGVRPFGLETAPHISTLIGLPIVALLASVLPPTAVGLGTDARREATRALRFTERRFRESMESSPIGMLMMDLNGVWTFTNAALQKMLGYSHEELHSFPPGGPSNPDDRKDIGDRWQKLKSNEIESYEIDRRFMHKNGGWIWVRATVSLVKDEPGVPLHFIAQIESLEARRSAEEKLASERERLRITLGTITDAVITADVQTRITYVNAAAEHLLGQALKDIEQCRLDDIISLTDPETSKIATSIVNQSMVHGTVFRRPSPSVLHRPDGSLSYVMEVVSPVLDTYGQVTGVVLVLHDASGDMQRSRDLSYQATHDALTGLSNRLEFQRCLKVAFEQTSHLDFPAAILAIDLDKFKAVNDSGGHAAGDAALRRVAEVLQSIVRRSDTIARLGGDEFAIILPNCPPGRCEVLGEQILRALNPLTIEWEGTVHTIGASIGLAMKTPNHKTEADWLAAADRASYQAKNSGRGQLRLAADLAPPLVEATLPEARSA